jgi:hypothetical protein
MARSRMLVVDDLKDIVFKSWTMLRSSRGTWTIFFLVMISLHPQIRCFVDKQKWHLVGRESLSITALEKKLHVLMRSCNLVTHHFLYIDRHAKSWVFQGSIVRVITSYFTKFNYDHMGSLEIFYSNLYGELKTRELSTPKTSTQGWNTHEPIFFVKGGLH